MKVLLPIIKAVIVSVIVESQGVQRTLTASEFDAWYGTTFAFTAAGLGAWLDFKQTAHANAGWTVVRVSNAELTATKTYLLDGGGTLIKNRRWLFQ